MTEVNERKSKMMSAQKVGILAVIANKQRSKLVNPSKATLTAESLLVDRSIEKAFPSAFDRFAVAFVLADVGNDVVIETDSARFQCIKSAVGIEERSGNRESKSLHGAEGTREVRVEVEGIVMIARHDPGRSHHIALRVGDGQNIRGFGAFSVLVRHTFAAFFRQRVTSIQVQVRQIEVFSNGRNTLLPNPLKTAVSAPFLEVIVDRLPAYLFFSGSFRDGAIGNCAH